MDPKSSLCCNISPPSAKRPRGSAASGLCWPPFFLGVRKKFRLRRWKKYNHTIIPNGTFNKYNANTEINTDTTPSAKYYRPASDAQFAHGAGDDLAVSCAILPAVQAAVLAA